MEKPLKIHQKSTIHPVLAQQPSNFRESQNRRLPAFRTNTKPQTHFAEIHHTQQRHRDVSCQSSIESPMLFTGLPQTSGHTAELSLKLSVNTGCTLTVTKSLSGPEASIPANLAALYDFYNSRATQLGWAVLKLAEQSPKLKKSIPEESLKSIKTKPSTAMKLLSEFETLLMVCRQVSPEGADFIESAMLKELENALVKVEQKAAEKEDKTEERNSIVVEGSEGVSKTGMEFDIASQMIDSLLWEQWKDALRDAILQWHSRNKSPPIPKDTIVQRFQVNARTPSGETLTALLSVGAAGADTMTVASQGPKSTASSSALLFSLQMTSDHALPREPELLEYLAARCWDSIEYPLGNPDSFVCSLETTTATAGEGNGVSSKSTVVDLTGTSRDLKVVAASLSALESEQFGDYTYNRWCPSDERIAFKKIRQKDGGFSYKLKKVTSQHGIEAVEEYSLTQAQIWALIDCLDTLNAMCPGFLPGSALPAVEPLKWWQKIF